MHHLSSSTELHGIHNIVMKYRQCNFIFGFCGLLQFFSKFAILLIFSYIFQQDSPILDMIRTNTSDFSDKTQNVVVVSSTQTGSSQWCRKGQNTTTLISWAAPAHILILIIPLEFRISQSILNHDFASHSRLS